MYPDLIMSWFCLAFMRWRRNHLAKILAANRGPIPARLAGTGQIWSHCSDKAPILTCGTKSSGKMSGSTLRIKRGRAHIDLHHLTASTDIEAVGSTRHILLHDLLNRPNGQWLVLRATATHAGHAQTTRARNSWRGSSWHGGSCHSRRRGLLLLLG